MEFFKRNKRREDLAALLRPAFRVPSHSVSMSEFVKAAEQKPFIVVGEIHPYELSAVQLVAPFWQPGNILFTEALRRGNYSEEGDALKISGSVYSHNSVKYDRLIKNCLDSGVQVHGIDLTREERFTQDQTVNLGSLENQEQRVKSWANYIIENMNQDSQNIILVGAGHVAPLNFVSVDLDKIDFRTYSPFASRANIATHLILQGLGTIDAKDILSISIDRSDNVLQPGIHEIEDNDNPLIPKFVLKV